MIRQHPIANIRIGIVGASPERGWAAMAHVPALRTVPSMTLQAVATRHERSARLAAAAFGAPLWFDDAHEMIAHAEVDAVVVAVKAPDHARLVRQALLAGKPVFCEWPFGRSLEEARELAQLACDRGVPTAVGLQGRFSPWLRQVREIVATGRLGRILSTSLLAWDELSTGSIDQGNAYLLDAANGANPLTIHCGHYIDSLCFVLGELDSVSVTTAISRPRVVVRQTGEALASSSPDQIAMCGQLNGAAFSFHMRAGSGDPSFAWEIQGEDAVLRVTSKGQLMWRPLRLERRDTREKRWETIAPPDPVEAGGGLLASDSPARFVAAAYEAFASDIRTGSRLSASFTEALARRETMEAIRTAAVTGTRWQPSGA
ncbi:Gfo/Idh/MocA family protein [Burkholderia sp. 3C]